jgi:hypothetical protein
VNDPLCENQLGDVNIRFLLSVANTYVFWLQMFKIAISLNPKRCWLFGQLNMRGELRQDILRKHSLTPPNFILEQQKESHINADVFS